MNARTRGTRGKLAVLLGTLALLGSMLPFMASVALAATFTVQIEPVAGTRNFSPQNLGNITAGDTITWTNVNGTHDVSSANIPATAVAWVSPILSGTATFSRTFTVAGNYRYFCSLHSSAAAANAATQLTTEQVGQFTVIADIIAPVAPTGLTATAAGGSQINLAWTPSTSTDVARQEVFRNTTNTRGTATLVQTFTNNTTAAYSDTGLTAATLYYYWLEAVDGALNRSTPATASAATTSVNAQVSATQIVIFNIPTTLQLSVTPASIDFGNVTPAVPATTAVGATTANVKSNAGWTLAVKSVGRNGIDEAPGDDAVFTSGLNTVPVGRLGWRIGSAAYTAMTDTNTTIGTPAVVATPAAGVDTLLQYQMTTQFSDPVGLDYRTVLLFTATSP